MKKYTLAFISARLSLLFVFLLPGFFSVLAYGAEVEIGGSYHTTVTEQGEVPANDYNKEKTKVKVKYTIPTKVNPVTKKKEFDLAKSSATFENEFKTKKGTPFVTEPIPITDVKGNPETGEIESFTVKSEKKWDPDLPAESNGLSGEINVKKKKGNLKSSYTSGGDKPTITAYTFATDNEPPAKPKNGKDGKPFEASTKVVDDGVSYDATTGILSILQDTIVETPDPMDSILGASVDFPEFQFSGLSTDGELAVFWPVMDEQFEISKDGEKYVDAKIPVLFFIAPQNLFWGALGDPTLAGLSPSSPLYNPLLSNNASPFLQGVENFLNPSSIDFNPANNFYATLIPDVDFSDLTDNFTRSGKTGASDLHFVTEPIDLPEPSSGVILLIGMIFLWWRRVARN